MKTESLREVKNNLSRVIDELSESGPVVITKSGKASAVLLPVDEDTDLETLLLSSNLRFDSGHSSIERSRASVGLRWKSFRSFNSSSLNSGRPASAVRKP